MVKGLLVEVDAKGNEVENGVKIEAAVITPAYIKDKKIKTKFVGAKKETALFLIHKKHSKATKPKFLHY
jgi:trigger factor